MLWPVGQTCLNGTVDVGASKALHSVWAQTVVVSRPQRRLATHDRNARPLRTPSTHAHPAKTGVSGREILAEVVGADGLEPPTYAL